MSPRVLFTTVYRKGSEPYDYIGANTRSWFRFYWPRIQSFGLRFLKQNIPELEILEFPTLDEYKKKLQEGWDVVGLSFYLSETHEAMEMVEAARHQPVETVGKELREMMPFLKKKKEAGVPQDSEAAAKQ